MPAPPRDVFTLTPDWICEILPPATGRFDRTRNAEVLSPSTYAIDRADTLPIYIYARERAYHVWMLDPRLQTLAAFVVSGAR